MSADREPLHAGAPWREVIHIASHVGQRGGPFWALTLGCGHVAYRSRRLPRMSDVGFDMVAMDKRPKRRKLTAPYRVKCLRCKLRAEEATDGAADP